MFERHYFADTQRLWYSIIKEAKYLGGRRPSSPKAESENTVSYHSKQLFMNDVSERIFRRMSAVLG